MMLAGASWSVFSTTSLVRGRCFSAIIVATGLILVYAQALTAGRMGYVTWGLVGLFLCFVRLRRYLLLAPLVVAAITWVVPGTFDRMFEGFSAATPGTSNRGGQFSSFYSDGPDIYTITAGRNVAWPYVLNKIGESPTFGFGRLAMQRTGITAFLLNEFREGFPHPHNAYLEMLLDNGWVGFLLVLPFYLVVIRHALLLFRDSRSPVFVAIGGATCSLVLSLLIASFGSQTFYPREGSVGMWCAIGLMFRVWVERKRALPGARKAEMSRPAVRRANLPEPCPIRAGGT